jgi:hypothetical protein
MDQRVTELFAEGAVGVEEPPRGGPPAPGVDAHQRLQGGPQIRGEGRHGHREGADPFDDLLEPVRRLDRRRAAQHRPDRVRIPGAERHAALRPAEGLLVLPEGLVDALQLAAPLPGGHHHRHRALQRGHRDPIPDAGPPLRQGDGGPRRARIRVARPLGEAPGALPVPQRRRGPRRPGQHRRPQLPREPLRQRRHRLDLRGAGPQQGPQRRGHGKRLPVLREHLQHRQRLPQRALPISPAAGGEAEPQPQVRHPGPGGPGGELPPQRLLVFKGGPLRGAEPPQGLLRLRVLRVLLQHAPPGRRRPHRVGKLPPEEAPQIRVQLDPLFPGAGLGPQLQARHQQIMEAGQVKKYLEELPLLPPAHVEAAVQRRPQRPGHVPGLQRPVDALPVQRPGRRAPLRAAA